MIDSLVHCSIRVVLPQSPSQHPQVKPLVSGRVDRCQAGDVGGVCESV